MSKIIATVAAVALAVGLSAGAASANNKGWDRTGPTPKCATPYEVSRVHLGDTIRQANQKLTAKHHRTHNFRAVAKYRPCRYFVADRGAVVLIRYNRAGKVTQRWATGGAFGKVRFLSKS